jgi:hypothetical protein
MAQYDPDQACARFIELHKKRDQDIDQRPDLERRMVRGDCDFSVDAAYELRDLEQEAQRNGSMLERTFDQDTMDFGYPLKKMTPEAYKAYVEWEETNSLKAGQISSFRDVSPVSTFV